MKFSVSLSSILFAAVFFALSAQAASSISSPNEALFITFYDDFNFVGNTYSPAKPVPNTCITLPSTWRNRAES
ncbi:hypothetical protein JR316_0009303 [Psilocybe cubensis]|uniref:Uncharacterized protein n=1 Tax=Psilocybe cubensis TaxID=181762 RepID=A0ACB8GUE0_PSICU|nr:hypothetical protein JR316_0009303 [Psilocybe cubensis]KAH9478841.1 hypothetical protein JR316_0009303 [Psilocybe cubensis]